MFYYLEKRYLFMIQNNKIYVSITNFEGKKPLVKSLSRLIACLKIYQYLIDRIDRMFIQVL